MARTSLKNFQLPHEKENDMKNDEVEKRFEGVQNAIRSQSDQLLQVSSLLGQLNQQFEFEKSNIKRLQLEMEKVGIHLKKYAP